MSTTSPTICVHGDGPQDIEITFVRPQYMRHHRNQKAYTRRHAESRIRLHGATLRGDNDAVEAYVHLPEHVTDADGDSCVAAAVEIQHVRITSISGTVTRLEGTLAAADLYPAESYRKLSEGADPASVVGTQPDGHVRYLPPPSTLFADLIGSRVEMVAVPVVA